MKSQGNAQATPHRRDSISTYTIPRPPKKWRGKDITPQLKAVMQSIGSGNFQRNNRRDIPDGPEPVVPIERMREFAHQLMAEPEHCGKTRHMSTAEYQQYAASFISTVWQDNPGTEAFCGEHAAMALRGLYEAGIPSDNLLIILFEAHTDNNHALVLYSEQMEQFSNGNWSLIKNANDPNTGCNLAAFADMLSRCSSTSMLIDLWSAHHKVTYLAGADTATVREHLLDNVLGPAGVKAAATKIVVSNSLIRK